MKRKVWIVAGLFLALPAAGLIFAWSGIYNVAATAGHWPPTAWLLHFAMRKSVETHASGLQQPDLDHPALVGRGAGHYETGCSPCHGAPGSPSNRIPNNMLPEPPYLPAVVESWSAEQLFWVAKHGLKYTGMPAWPAQGRDDEVWAVTAFLLRLPGMSPEDYAALTKGAGGQLPAAEADKPPLPEAPGELFTMTDAALIGACVRCHGLDGSGRPSGAFPRLDINGEEYLARALDEYASGVRPSGIMQPVAAALEPAQIGRVARHYAEAAGAKHTRPGEATADVIALGRQIASDGIADKQVPACAACHGLGEGPDNPQFPTLNGQFAAYTIPQLQLWKEGKRGGGAYSEIMQAAARNLSTEEMTAVAHFYESLPAVRSDRPQAAAEIPAPSAP